MRSEKGEGIETIDVDPCGVAQISFLVTAASDVISLTGIGAAALYGVKGARLLKAGRTIRRTVDPISGAIRTSRAANLVDQGGIAVAQARTKAAAAYTAG